MANVLLLLGLLLGLFLLRQVTDSGVFATIVLLVFGVMWACNLYASRKLPPKRDRKDDRPADRSA